MNQELHTDTRRNGKFFWTEPYHGVTHCGKFGLGNCWVFISDYGSFATLDKFDWRKDKLVSTGTETYDSKTLAVVEAEKWLTSVGL